MSKKENKFDPPVGYMVAVQHHIVMVERLAVVLNFDDPVVLMDIEIKKRKLQSVPTMADVAESVTELDEENAEAKQ